MVATGDNTVDLAIVAGLPYKRRIRVPGGTALWNTVDSFEVRGQIRQKDDPTSALVANLTPFLTGSIDGEDIVVDLVMTGQQTRQLGKGVYDIIVSDKGAEDARAVPVLGGKVTLEYVLTAASGDV